MITRLKLRPGQKGTKKLAAVVPVHIGFSDTDPRKIAKTARGRWDPEQRLWFIRYGKIKGTVLEKHIIVDAFPRDRK